VPTRTTGLRPMLYHACNCGSPDLSSPLRMFAEQASLLLAAAVLPCLATVWGHQNPLARLVNVCGQARWDHGVLTRCDDHARPA
jgi:hypothetical protein